MAPEAKQTVGDIRGRFTGRAADILCFLFLCLFYSPRFIISEISMLKIRERSTGRQLLFLVEDGN